MDYNKEFREKLIWMNYIPIKIEFQNKTKIYQKILSRIHKKIKHTSKLKNNDEYLFYLILEFILGTPKYDVGAFTLHVINKLQRKWISNKMHVS